MQRLDWKLAGHENQRAQLVDDITQDNLAHTYLFYGPKEVGKFRLAKTYANILQCDNSLCGRCSVCVQIDKGCHYDTIIFKDDGNSLKIQDVQNLIAKLSTTSQSNYKVVIIEDIERLTLPAANALLKTLEEPGEKTVFILTTNDMSNILDTIRSRARLVKFNHVSSSELEEYLEKKNVVVDEHTKSLAKTFAFGSVGRFFRLIENSDDLKNTKELYDALLRLIENDSLPSKFAYIKSVAEDRDKAIKTLEMLTHIVRSMLLAKVGNTDHFKGLPEVLHGYSESDLLELIEKIEYAKSDIHSNINTKLVLENIFLHAA